MAVAFMIDHGRPNPHIMPYLSLFLGRSRYYMHCALQAGLSFASDPALVGMQGNSR